MSKPNAPTLLSPSGGETYVSPQITISWENPAEISTDGYAVWYEIYYTDRYFSGREQDWIQIATVPVTSTEFSWTVGNRVRSSRVRVGIRSRSSTGERSEMCVSAADFSVNRLAVPTPKVLSPKTGGRYSTVINIVTDQSGGELSRSAANEYQFYYASPSASVPMTPVGHPSPSQDTVMWDVSSLPPADDYSLYYASTDDQGNSVQKLLVKDISIAHEGFFYIDTTPPEASIKVVASSPFTNQSDVAVRVFTEDAATAAHASYLKNGENETAADSVRNVQTITLSDGDGEKTVEAVIQDYGANRREKPFRFFSDPIGYEDLTVVDFAMTDEAVFAVTAGAAYRVYKLSPYPSHVATLSEEPTAVGGLGGQLYVGTRVSDGRGRLNTLANGSIVQVAKLPDNDSIITCMSEYESVLYVGTSNGGVWSYDGSRILGVKKFGGPIESMSSDDAVLYLSVGGTTDVVTFDGTDFSAVPTEEATTGEECPDTNGDCCDTYVATISGGTDVDGEYTFDKVGGRWLSSFSGGTATILCSGGEWEMTFTFTTESCSLTFTAPADPLIDTCPPYGGWSTEDADGCNGEASVSLEGEGCIWESSSSSNSSSSSSSSDL